MASSKEVAAVSRAMSCLLWMTIDLGDPPLHLRLDVHDVLDGVAAPGLGDVPLGVDGSGCVDDVDHGVGLPDDREEPVAEAPAHPGVLDEPRDVQNTDGDVAPFVDADGVDRVVLHSQLVVDAGVADVGGPLVRLLGGEGVVGYLCVEEGRRVEEGGLPHVSLPDDSDRQQGGILSLYVQLNQ